MKQIIKKKLLISITLCILFGGYHVYRQIAQKKAIAQRIGSLPEFSFAQLDGGLFTKSNIIPNASVFFLYFNSECTYCLHEVQDIKENLGQFQRVQLIFVSTEPMANIRQFAQNQKLNAVSNIIFLQDNLGEFATIFGTNHIPSSLVYNTKQELVLLHKGQIRASTLLKYL